MEATTTATTGTGISRSYVYNKLFSLLGVIPLSVFTVWHLWNNLTALQGPESFNAYLERTRSIPFMNGLMILFIWIPFFAHAIYGLSKIKMSRPNNVRFTYWDNLRYLTQRLSAIGVLLFLPAHMIKSKIIPTWIDGTPADFQHMTELADPIVMVVYALGILGVAYHLANGIWQVGIGWGITTTQKAMDRMQVFCILLFLTILTMGYLTLFTFVRVGHGGH